MKRYRGIRTRCFWSVCVLWAVGLAPWSLSAAVQELVFQVGGETHFVGSEVREGVRYFPLRRIAQVLDLGLRQEGATLRVGGPRGVLELSADRPLVRSGEQYILLSHPMSRGQGTDWYVPLDFVSKALPTILNRKLTVLDEGRFQVESTGSNRIVVDVISHPDRLSVVFRASRPAPSRVRNLQDHLEVIFDEYMVEPVSIELPERDDLLQDIEFLRQEGMGGFRLRKGDRFGRFRSYELSNPPRVVVDLYRDTPPPATEPSPPEISEAPDPTDEEDDSEPVAVETAVSVARERWIVIDPGHGGSDYGADILDDLLEKRLVLDLARRMEQGLSREGKRARLTRFRDVDLSVEQRSGLANFYRAIAYVGLHVGASPTPETRGPVVYVYGGPGSADSGANGGENTLVPWDRAHLEFVGSSRRLALRLQRRLNQIFEAENQVAEAPLAVLESVRAPAVVVELGYLTNEEDFALLSDEASQTELVEALVAVVMEFSEER